jgi:hypothetical protein
MGSGAEDAKIHQEEIKIRGGRARAGVISRILLLRSIAPTKKTAADSNIAAASSSAINEKRGDIFRITLPISLVFVKLTSSTTSYPMWRERGIWVILGL